MEVPTYELEQSEPDKSLSLNEFYFCCDTAGHYLKTKNLQEFREVLKWNNIIFSEKIKSNQFLHFKIGSSWKKISFQRLKNSEPIEIGIFDIHLIQHDLSSHITQVKIGGKETPEIYEML